MLWTPMLCKHRWFITANDFGASAKGAIIAIEKAPTLIGGGTAARCWNNLNFNIVPPIVLDKKAKGVFLSPGSGAGNTITRYDLKTTAVGVGSDVLTTKPSFNINAWTAPPDAVQPVSGQKLDSLDGRFQSASIQHRRFLWNIHAVNVGGRPLIRWYKLKAGAGSNVKSTVTFTTGVDDHLFNPSIATASKVAGTRAFITASRTDPTQAVTGKAAHLMFWGDNANGAGWLFNVIDTSPTEFTDAGGISCNASSRGSCRWGDYSATQVDPKDKLMGWGFNQLIDGNTQWNWYTRGAAVK